MAPTVLTLPGWLNSGPAHWQSRWEALHGYTRVAQHDWQRPLRGDWMAQLEETVLRSEGPVLLAAHSLGCHLVAAWAAHSQHAARVRGALLVAAPDVTQADFPADLYNWRKPVLQPLPFAATCVVSSNDPFGSEAAGLNLAQAWGARAVQLGAYGHINGDSGLGDWPAGHALLQALHAQPAQHVQPVRRAP
jgi:uncharacterized protein